MGEMIPDKGVFKRKGSDVWQHRVYVPKDVQAHYGGKDALPARSLATKDLAEANRHARQRLAELELEFAAKRAGTKTAPPTKGPSAFVSPEQIERWAADYRTQLTDADFATRSALFEKASSDPKAFWSGKLAPLPEAWRRTGGDLSYWDYLIQDEASTLEQGIAFVLRAYRQERLRVVREALQAGRTDLLASVADTYLEGSIHDASQRLRLLRRLMQVEIVTLTGIDEDAAATFPAMTTANANSASEIDGTENPLLSSVVKSWLAEKSSLELTGRRLEDCQAAADLFIEVVGDKPVASYSKGDVREFKDVLRRLPANRSKIQETRGLSVRAAAKKAERLGLEPMKVKTANNKYLATLSNLFEYALGNYDSVHRNPFVNATLPTRSNPREVWDPFTTEALQVFFRAPLYTGCVSAAKWMEPGPAIPRDSARFWLPLILLFTGARVNEICKLRVTDIREENGIAFFNIEWDEDDVQAGITGRVKNVASERKVPIHADLISFGLMAFVERMRTAGHERLFPELKPNRHGKLYGTISQRFSDTFLARLGIKTPRTSLKSFRHNFVDAATNSRIADEIILALKGDTRPGTLARYGDGKTELEILADEMRKLKFRDLALPHLVV